MVWYICKAREVERGMEQSKEKANHYIEKEPENYHYLALCIDQLMTLMGMLGWVSY
jgi:hypothetical protein